MVKNYLFTIIILFLATSCVSYYNIKGNDPDLDSTIMQEIKNSPEKYNKGEACVQNILGVAAFGDSSLGMAKENGNIKEIYYSYTSYKRLNIYFRIYQKGCTIAIGEKRDN